MGGLLPRSCRSTRPKPSQIGAPPPANPRITVRPVAGFRAPPPHRDRIARRSGCPPPARIASSQVVTSGPVSRILSSVTIPLRAAVADGLMRPTRAPRASSARSVSATTGVVFLVLLRVGFTEPPQSPGVLVVSYTTVSPLPHRGGLFSVALSRGSPRVGVTHHPALRSPDFPQPCGRGHPVHSSRPVYRGVPESPHRPHHGTTRRDMSAPSVSVLGSNTNTEPTLRPSFRRWARSQP